MTLSDEYALACYEPIAVLDERHGIRLVQHRASRKIFVKKVLTVFNPSVFQFLKEHHIRGTPEIAEAIADGDTLIVIEEYISGDTLRSLLDNGGRFSEQEAVTILTQLCAILRRLHEASPPIVHRDIKPSNIILTSDGEVKLIDMNAAKFQTEHQTKDTELIGTNGYAAPEQYGFRASGCQADIFALGVLLNEMLVGQPPNEVRASGWLGGVVEKCTRMDPKDRYASVEELLRELVPPKPEREQERGASLCGIPGFRSGNSTNMVVAALGYGLIFLLGLTLKVPSAQTVRALWLERFFFIFSSLLVVALSCNFANLWHALNIDRIRNPYLRAAVVLLLNAASVLLLMLIMVTLE